MTGDEHNTQDHFDQTQTIDSIVSRFRDEWEPDSRPDIEQYLPDEPIRHELLLELIRLDLSLGYDTDAPRPLEEYLSRFPELTDDSDALFELIRAEHETRVRHQHPSTLHEYQSRFPELADSLETFFRDESIQETYAVSNEGRGGDRATFELPGYEILGELGKGGMGIVYKGRDTTLDRLVAIKTIRGDVHDDETLDRFLGEARAVARLRHAHIVQIYEIGDHERNPFFSLEYVEGGTLADHAGGTPQDARVAAEVVESLARAMATAHDAGVVHRDLKPANVLLSFSSAEAKAEHRLDDSVAKITDFGLAKHIHEDKGLTQSGQIMGTPSYASPEQASGLTESVGPVSDVYSLGAILYDLLTGRPPFKGVSVLDTLQQVRERDPIPPRQLLPSIPADLELICLKCLEKEMHRRYESAEQLADELRCYLDGEPLKWTRAVGPIERGVRWCRRHPARALAFGFGGLAVVALAAFLVQRRFAQDRELAANRLQAEQGRTLVALEKAKVARDRAETERARAEKFQKEATRLNAVLSLDEGIELARQGEVAESLRWFERSRTLAPADVPRVRALAKANFEAWKPYVHEELASLAHEKGITQPSLSEDGRVLLTRDSSKPQVVQVWNLADDDPKAVAVTLSSAPKRVAISADGQTIVTETADKEIRLWESATGKPIGEPVTSSVEVLDVVVSPDGDCIAFLGKDNAVRLRSKSAFGGEPVVYEHPDVVKKMRFDRVGSRLITACKDSKLRVWSLKTGKEEHPPMEAVSGVTYLEVDSGNTLLVAGDALSAQLYRLETGASVGARWRYNKSIRAVVFSPDSKLVAVGSWDKTVKLWDTATGELVGEPLLHRMDVKSVAFHPSGRLLLTGGGGPSASDGEVRLWDVATRKLIGEPVVHHGQVTKVVFTPDGRFFVSMIGGAGLAQCWSTSSRLPHGQPMRVRDRLGINALAGDGSKVLLVPRSGTTAKLWRLAKGIEAGVPLDHPSKVHQVAFSPDGALFATACEDGKARVWQTESRKWKYEPIALDEPIRFVSFTHDGKQLLTSTGKTRYRWETATGARVRVKFSKPANATLAKLSLEGDLVLTAERKRPPPFSRRPPTSVGQLWSVATGKPIGGKLSLRSSSPTVTFAPGGKYVAVRGTYRPGGFGPPLGYASVYETKTGKVVVSSSSGMMRIGRVAFNSEGTVFAMSRYRQSWGTLLGSEVVFWRLTDVEPKAVTLRTFEWVSRLVLSPKGNYLALSEGRRHIRIWDTKTGKPVGSRLYSPEGIVALSFDPTDSLLATLEDGKDVQVWDVATGKPLGPMLSHGSGVTSVAFHPTKPMLLTATESGEARLWQIPSVSEE